MADDFSDLEELGIDVNSLSVAFTTAANRLQKIQPNVDNQSLLTLYGYYKQALEGRCTVPKPSWYDLRAKAKWEAWNKLGDMSKQAAQQRYIEVIKAVDPSFDVTEPSDQWAKVSSMVAQSNTTALTIVDHIRDNGVGEIEKFVASAAPDAVYDGLPLVHWAADSGSVAALRKLIELGADVDSLDGDGQTALHYAASCGHVDCVELLLRSGARKDMVDGDGNTPFDISADDDIKQLLN